MTPVRRGLRPAWLVALALAVVAIAGWSIACGSGPATSDGAGVTDPAPDFDGTTLSGIQVSTSLFRGKPLVLAFIASW